MNSHANDRRLAECDVPTSGSSVESKAEAERGRCGGTSSPRRGPQRPRKRAGPTASARIPAGTLAGETRYQTRSQTLERPRWRVENGSMVLRTDRGRPRLFRGGIEELPNSLDRNPFALLTELQWIAVFPPACRLIRKPSNWSSNGKGDIQSLADRRQREER
jgi:hypothetical protein